MELRNNPNVFFEEVSHSYWVEGGQELMGVTTLMKKHGLSPDYSDIPDKVLEKAAKEGTELHQEIEDYDNGISLLQTPLTEEYHNLCLERGLKFVCNELLVSDEELVASKIDGVYQGSTPNSYILVDYKSTQKVHNRALSFQLSIYRYLFEKQFPGTMVESLWVLHLDKKKRKILGFYPVDPIPDSEIEALLDAERNGRIYVDDFTSYDVSATLSNDEVSTYVSSYSEVLELKERLDSAQAALKDLDHKILEWMEANNIEEADGPDGIRFKIKKAYSRSSVDSTKFKKEYPLIYNQMLKTTTVSSSLLVSKK